MQIYPSGVALKPGMHVSSRAQNAKQTFGEALEPGKCEAPDQPLRCVLAMCTLKKNGDLVFGTFECFGNEEAALDLILSVPPNLRHFAAQVVNVSNFPERASSNTHDRVYFYADLEARGEKWGGAPMILEDLLRALGVDLLENLRQDL